MFKDTTSFILPWHSLHFIRNKNLLQLYYFRILKKVRIPTGVTESSRTLHSKYQFTSNTKQDVLVHQASSIIREELPHCDQISQIKLFYPSNLEYLFKEKELDSSGFARLSPFDTLGWEIFVVGCCPIHCRVFSSMPGLHPLHTINTPLKLCQLKITLDIMYLEEQNSLLPPPCWEPLL